MLPFVFVGVGLLAYFYWQGDSIAAQHAQSSAQAAAAASASQATPAGARPAAPLIIGPQDGTQTTLAQTGASIATHSATAPAFDPPPVAPTMVLPVATLPQSMSTNPTGAPTGPLNSSATAVQSSPIITVPAPPAHDVGTPPVFAATIQSVPSTSYAPVVPFAPTILSPAATCAGIVPGQ